jgi:hypothetical protein
MRNKREIEVQKGRKCFLTERALQFESDKMYIYPRLLYSFSVLSCFEVFTSSLVLHVS